MAPSLSTARVCQHETQPTSCEVPVTDAPCCSPETPGREGAAVCYQCSQYLPPKRHPPQHSYDKQRSNYTNVRQEGLLSRTPPQDPLPRGPGRHTNSGERLLSADGSRTRQGCTPGVPYVSPPPVKTPRRCIPPSEDRSCAPPPLQTRTALLQAPPPAPVKRCLRRSRAGHRQPAEDPSGGNSRRRQPRPCSQLTVRAGPARTKPAARRLSVWGRSRARRTRVRPAVPRPARHRPTSPQLPPHPASRRQPAHPRSPPPAAASTRLVGRGAAAHWAAGRAGRGLAPRPCGPVARSRDSTPTPTLSPRRPEMTQSRLDLRK